MKATNGAGAFALVNTGVTPVVLSHRLLTTNAYRLGEETTARGGSIGRKRRFRSAKQTMNNADSCRS
ncbi:hypothetical protein, partial [Roseiarcus sp.]|uniref:hypothetical protein n=1 Tax=Roseiarcus sp. TaxID=1969460 RepID=UPI003C79085C